MAYLVQSTTVDVERKAGINQILSGLQVIFCNSWVSAGKPLSDLFLSDVRSPKLGFSLAMASFLGLWLADGRGAYLWRLHHVSHKLLPAAGFPDSLAHYRCGQKTSLTIQSTHPNHQGISDSLSPFQEWLGLLSCFKMDVLKVNFVQNLVEIW